MYGCSPAVHSPRVAGRGYISFLQKCAELPYPPPVSVCSPLYTRLLLKRIGIKSSSLKVVHALHMLACEGIRKRGINLEYLLYYDQLAP